MDLTIIIVNWNTADMLKNCLLSIEKNVKNIEYNIIVVDNASTDGSIDMVSSLLQKVKIIESGGNIGFARANNLAIPFAETPFIMFLNPDTLILGNTIKEMIQFMRNYSNIGMIGPKMLNLDRSVQVFGPQLTTSPFSAFLKMFLYNQYLSNLFPKLFRIQNPNESNYVSHLCGGCLLVRKETLQKVGYFDERFFMYGEDYDLCKRIIDADWRIYYLSESSIIHLGGVSTNNAHSSFSVLMMCESIGKLIQKYYGKIGKIFYRCIVFFGSIYRIYILVFLLVLNFIFLKKQNGKEIYKYILMLKWSLNLEKPIIYNYLN